MPRQSQNEPAEPVGKRKKESCFWAEHGGHVAAGKKQCGNGVLEPRRGAFGGRNEGRVVQKVVAWV